MSQVIIGVICLFLGFVVEEKFRVLGKIMDSLWGAIKSAIYRLRRTNEPR
jgi:hypothetical protein